MWHSDDEEESWKLTSNCIATSTESTPKRLTEDAYIGSGTNKSFFISIRPGVDKLISVFPIVLISPGDLLGIFPGKIRFSERCNVAQSLRDLHCIFGWTIHRLQAPWTRCGSLGRVVDKQMYTWLGKVSTKMWRVVRVSPGEFWSWPLAKLCLLSRLFVRLLQRNSSHFTNHLTTQEGASWKRLSNSNTSRTSAYIRDNIKIVHLPDLWSSHVPIKL